jgi:hypothetical protein
MMIVAGDPPDFRTISEFRRRHLKALAALFVLRCGDPVSFWRIVMTSHPMPLLSGYPARKIHDACDKCNLSVQYDRDALLEADGDRTLSHLTAIARRHACALVYRPGFSPYNRCDVRFPQLPDLHMRTGRL